MIILSSKFLRIFFPLVGLVILSVLQILQGDSTLGWVFLDLFWMANVILAIFIRKILQKKRSNHWVWILVVPSILFPVLLEASYAFGIDFNITTVLLAFLMLYVLLLSEVKYLIIYNKQHIEQLLAVANAKYAEYAYNALKSRSVVSFLQRALQDAKKLIAISEKRAITYIEKLTTILRYLLQSRNETLVPVYEEAKMVQELADLHFTQSGVDVDLTIDVPRMTVDHAVPPFVLQMIVDNIFLNYPIIGRSFLEVYVENNIYLVVKFSGSAGRTSSTQEFSQLIKDLQQRYEILDQRSEVVTIFSNTSNYVKLPLIST